MGVWKALSPTFIAVSATGGGGENEGKLVCGLEGWKCVYSLKCRLPLMSISHSTEFCMGQEKNPASYLHPVWWAGRECLGWEQSNRERRTLEYLLKDSTQACHSDRPDREPCWLFVPIMPAWTVVYVYDRRSLCRKDFVVERKTPAGAAAGWNP